MKTLMVIIFLPFIIVMIGILLGMLWLGIWRVLISTLKTLTRRTI